MTPSPVHSRSEDLLTPGEILRVTLKHLRLIGWITFGFLAVGILAAFLWPKTYEAMASVKVPDNSTTAMGMLRTISPSTSKSGDPLETFLDMAESDNVTYRVIAQLNLRSHPEFQDDSLQELVTHLSKVVKIEDAKKSNIFAIDVRSKDPVLAADIANAWAQAFIQLNLDLSHESATTRRKFLEDQTEQMERKARSRVDEAVYGQLVENLQAARLDENTDDTGINVIDKAVVPEKPVFPKKVLFVALALLLGLAAGVQGAFWLERARDRVEGEKALIAASSLPNLAIIPNYREDYPEGMAPPDMKERFSPKYLIHNPVFQHSRYRESFKLLLTKLNLAHAGSPPSVIALLSANPSEGKTLANANLAISSAEGGKRTLLVDLDLRRPAVAKCFGMAMEEGSGIPLALSGQADWKGMVKPSGIPNLDLLPNSLLVPNPVELLGSARMAELLREFRKDYAYVVLDCAPVLPVADSVVLAPLVEGVVLLVRYNATRIPEMEKALEHLRSVKAPLLGTVLNDVRLEQGFYGYGGYGYGKYHYGPESKGK